MFALHTMREVSYILFRSKDIASLHATTWTDMYLRHGYLETLPKRPTLRVHDFP